MMICCDTLGATLGLLRVLAAIARERSVQQLSSAV